MDYKDILMIIAVVIFVVIMRKFFPDNSLITWGIYIKAYTKSFKKDILNHKS